MVWLNKLFSNAHIRLNRELHQKKRYGVSGRHEVSNVNKLIEQVRDETGAPVTLLDYGCGKQTLTRTLIVRPWLNINLYDPGVEGLEAQPKFADIVTCTDVLEHIEPEYLDNVLEHLRYLTKRVCYVSVSMQEAVLFYGNGQNAHIIVEDCDWWTPRLQAWFDIVKFTQDKRKVRFSAILTPKAFDI